MLGACEDVKSCLICERDVARAGHVCVQQRGRARPVFAARISENQLRYRAERSCTLQHAALGTGYGIALVDSSEGEKVGRVLMVLVRAAVTCGLGETVVEAALASTADMDQRAVEHRVPDLVHVEALPNHVTDHAARLGDAEDKHMLDAASPAEMG